MIPYLLLQLITVTDSQRQGDERESLCKVRIVGATYSKDGQDGGLCILNLLSRVRQLLLKKTVIGGRFMLDLQSKLEMLIYPDDTQNYYLGEMMTTWIIPSVEREVQI